jgi:hypothetical protein
MHAAEVSTFPPVVSVDARPCRVVGAAPREFHHHFRLAIGVEVAHRQRMPVGCTYSIFLQIARIWCAAEFMHPTGWRGLASAPTKARGSTSPDAFDELGFPRHVDGASAVAPSLHFVGVHFLRKRKSSIFLGVGEDAALLAASVAARV